MQIGRLAEPVQERAELAEAFLECRVGDAVEHMVQRGVQVRRGDDVVGVHLRPIGQSHAIEERNSAMDARQRAVAERSG